MNCDSKVIQEITAIVDSLGFWDNQEKVYQINEDTCECIKELLRLLRKDGSGFPVLRHLGSINIVEKDLIPIIKSYCLTDEALAEYTIRLLVTLTYPALVFFKEKMPNEVDQKRIFIEINGFLRIYKLVFSQQKDFWEILCKKAQTIIEKEPLEQSEEDKIFLERILILVRNVLHVPKDTALDVADEDEMITEDFIVSLKASGILDLILQFTTDAVGHQFCFHLLEIMYSLFRGQCPEFLGVDQSESQHLSKRTRTCANFTESLELEELKEKERKLQKFSKANRFNRFRDSTYVIKNFKSISENDLIYHKTTEDVHKISLDQGKTAERKPKHRAPMTDNFITQPSGIYFRRPSNKVYKILREFCEKFLKESYNSLMAYIKSALDNNNAQENDETYYFFCAQFFMGFNRVSGGDANLIATTFNFPYFHYLHSKIVYFSEHIENARSDRRAILAYSRRCLTSLKAYKELLLSIASMKHVQDDQMLGHAKEILEKAFVEFDYLELPVTLLNNYNEQKMSPQFLKDLIETNHVFLKMLEHFSDPNSNHLDLFFKYCNFKVIRAYLLALQRFDVNPEKLNHAIIRMFKRIACDCKHPILFFQLSVFRVFHRCFELIKREKNDKLVEIANFARFIIREFVKLAKNNNKLLAEILFWKNKTEISEIETNYTEIAPQKSKKRNGKRRKKNKNGTNSDSDKSELSEDERDGVERIEDLSNGPSSDFVPLFSSTQNPPSERPDELSKLGENVTGHDQSIGIDGSELPCESELMCTFGADNGDDDLLDLDEILDKVADDEKDESFGNQLDVTVVENDLLHSQDVPSDTDSIEQINTIKRKKKIIFDESDDE